MLDTIIRIAEIAAPALAIAIVVTIIAIWVITGRGVPFRVHHFWTNLPLIGTIARLGWLRAPTKREADKRLERVYRGYRKLIPERPSAEVFHRAKRYLFLAGDSATRPMLVRGILLLVALLAGESLSFAFLLGGKLWADASEDDVRLFAVLITVVIVALLAFFGHYVGGVMRRRSVLVEAWRHALDPTQVIPGERPMVELTSQVSLNENQERDQPRQEAADAQRRLNRVATFPGDQGKLWPTLLYAVIVLVVAGLQFELRTLSNVATSAANLISPGGELDFLRSRAADDNASTFYANLFFVLIFGATQIFAVLQGFRHRFVGVESVAAYRLTGGLDAFGQRQRAWDAMTRAADEALTNLLTRFERYPHIRPDKALYLERVAREEVAPVEDGDNDPPAPAAESNVTPLPLGGGK